MDVKFIRFQKMNATKTNTVSYSGQVFKNLENNLEVSLDIAGVEHNSKYKVIYGRHSKIGIPLNKLSK